MEGIIQSSVAAGVAEALSRQNPNPGFIAPQSTDMAMDLDPPSDISTTQLNPPSEANNTPVLEPMDVDSGDLNQKVLHYLRLFYKDIRNPQFRSKGQQKMVELAFAGNQNFVGVLPTGGGKSLVFLLPAFAATLDPPLNGLVPKTLVIIPNKSLMEDTLRKAMKFGVSCARWTVNTSDRAIKDTALVLIAIESLASYKFKQYVFY